MEAHGIRPMESDGTWENWIRLWLVSLLVTAGQGYPFFVNLIPNAFRVKHPCLFFFPWPGVGHFNAFGGFGKNPFGEDFQSAGFKWTKELCEKDSDQDGRTNGQELGDPDCEWSPGKTPKRRILITHPGFKRFDPEGCFCPFQIFCPFNKIATKQH